MIEVVINGEERSLAEALPLSALLTQCGYSPEGIAVALNRECIRRAEYATTMIAHGDEVEILAPMAGG